jgi:hypothetical protein
MPTLLELQRAVCRGLVAGEDAGCAAQVVADGIVGEARLNLHRNAFIRNLTTALRLVYPAVCRLVGAPFFENASRLFIEAEPPRSAWLDAYGADFPEFLAGFPPAATLHYLPGIARLERRSTTPCTPPTRSRSTCRVSPPPRLTATSFWCRIPRSVSSPRPIRWTRSAGRCWTRTMRRWQRSTSRPGRYG